MVQPDSEAGGIGLVLIMQEQRKKAVVLTTGLLALAFIVLLIVGFVYAGSLLVVEGPPHHADVGLVLAGNFGRAMYAADLFHQGFIPRIWISRPEREKHLAQLDTLGVPYPRQEQISLAVLLRKGVPEDRIEVIGDGVISTIAEARLVSDLLEKRSGIRSVLLITSRFHVRRAEAIFQYVLRPRSQVEIFAVGSPYDGFVADHWWRDRDSARQVFLETAKLLLFWVNTEF